MKYMICLAVWILTFAVGGALFWTSNKVQEAESVNYGLVAGLQKQQDDLTVLQAEWDYLNNPAYLDKLVQATFNHSAQGAMMLASSASLPRMRSGILPVRKPEVPESLKKEQPVIVAVAKTVQPVMKSQVTPESPKQKSQFSMVLASWTN